jgi:hypothetical protein
MSGFSQPTHLSVTSPFVLAEIRSIRRLDEPVWEKRFPKLSRRSVIFTSTPAPGLALLEPVA